MPYKSGKQRKYMEVDSPDAARKIAVNGPAYGKVGKKAKEAVSSEGDKRKASKKARAEAIRRMMRGK